MCVVSESYVVLCCVVLCCGDNKVYKMNSTVNS